MTIRGAIQFKLQQDTSHQWVVIEHCFVLPLQGSVEERIMEMVQQRKEGGRARDPSSSRENPWAYMDQPSGSARNQVCSCFAGLACPEVLLMEAIAVSPQLLCHHITSVVQQQLLHH